ncbi:MurR/RpiR family transcriptional regulator [Virgibacillus ihumii]|uniref:MurR/RpiR family transcriptional regulator n=1 Tax=Virgibacillus ihumii TaxID=2686091 RepID=UPI001FECEAC6|nr:hypothetical protein [Virgibacillus ihumii]
MYNFLAKLLNFIESSTDSTKSEIIIAEYILRNVNKIPKMSIYELAKECHTSPATITRFCHRFENITFKELKEYARTFIEFNYTEVDYENLELKINLSQLNSYYNELQASLRNPESYAIKGNSGGCETNSSFPKNFIFRCNILTLACKKCAI